MVVVVSLATTATTKTQRCESSHRYTGSHDDTHIPYHGDGGNDNNDSHDTME